MNNWRTSAQKNLIAWSKEKENYIVAAQEWEFTGEVIDHGKSNNRCDLCEGENLRYHFEVKNYTVGKIINVGSSCITKFGLTVRDEEGKIIDDNKEKHKFLKNILYEKQKEVYLEKMREIYRTTEDEYLRIWIEHMGKTIKANDKFSITEAVELHDILESNNIFLDKSIVQFNTRTLWSISWIAQLDEEDLEKTLCCLPQNQRKSVKTRLLKKYGIIL